MEGTVIDEETGWERRMTSARSFRRLVAELDSSHTHPLISFKYQDQSPGSLMDASHSSKHCWPTSGRDWRGLGTRGLGRPV